MVIFHGKMLVHQRVHHFQTAWRYDAPLLVSEAELPRLVSAEPPDNATLAARARCTTELFLNLFINLSKIIYEYIYLFKFMIGLRSFFGDIWFSIATYFGSTQGTSRAYQLQHRARLDDRDDHGWYPPFSGLQCSTWDVKYVKYMWNATEKNINAAKKIDSMTLMKNF